MFDVVKKVEFGRLSRLQAKSSTIRDFLIQIEQKMISEHWIKSETALSSPISSLVRILTGHSAGVTSIVLTPDGNNIISGSGDGSIRVWDWKTEEQLHILIGHSDWVESIVLTPDGNNIISGSYCPTISNPY